MRKKRIDDHIREISDEIVFVIEQIVIEKVDSKFREVEAQHVNTVWKYDCAELFKDEFKAFQAKVHDQGNLDLLKSHFETGNSNLKT